MPSRPVHQRLSALLTADRAPASLIGPADAAQFDRVRVIDRRAVHTPFGTMFVCVLAFDDALAFKVPVLPLSVVLEPAANRTVTTRVFVGPDWFVEADRLAVAVRFDPLLLRPVDPAQAFAEARAESGVRVTRDRFELTDPAVRFSLPPSEIRGTGIVLSLEGLLFDLSSDTTPDVLLGLGYDAAFQGIYAERGTLRVLPVARFGDQTGLEIGVNDVVIGTSGVSCRLEEFFSIDPTAAAPAGAAAGQLLGAAWPFALASIEGEIRDNEPVAFAAAGRLRVPIIDLPFDVRFGIERGPGADPDRPLRYTLHATSAEAGQIATPFGTVAYGDLAFDGLLDGAGVEVAGAATALLIDLDPLRVQAAQATVRFAHEAGGDTATIALRDVTLGPLGPVGRADLLVEDGPGGRAIRVQTELTWRDLSARVQVPSELPSPPDDARVSVLVQWHEDQATGAHRMTLAADASVGAGLDTLWAFVPAAFRPSVRNATLHLEVEYDSTAAFDGADAAGALQGAFSARFEVRLPPLGAFPGRELVSLQTGNADGWMRASLSAGLDQQGNQRVAVELLDIASLDVSLPGVVQPDPPIHLELDALSFQLQAGASASGAVELGGRCSLRPVAPPSSLPLAEHLARLLAPIQLGVLSGTVDGRMAFAGDRSEFTVSCEFADASVTVDVFDLLARLTGASGGAAPRAASANEVDLDLDVGFALRRLAFQLGSLDPANTTTASAEVGLAVTVGPVSVGGFVRISDEAIVIGVGDLAPAASVRELAVPLGLPRFPVASADVAALHTDADWQTALTDLRQRVATLAAQPPTRARDRELALLETKGALLGYIFSIRRQLAGPTNQAVYQAGVETIVGALEVATSITRATSRLSLVLRDVQFVIPFSDPRGLRAEGSARITGFSADDPFRPIEELVLGVGLSAERIFFSTESAGTPIPLPDFGRYPGGSVSLSRFTVGYGYTKNSLSVTFEGALTLPPQLTQDADTSRALGAGVRLPTHSQLAFKLDLVPIPGPIPVAPLFEFDLDLRSPGAPGLLSSAVCTPFWDGLQLHVPGVFRADLKRLAMSPVFSLLPVPNARFAGDLELGDAGNGLTVVVDDLLVLAGLVVGAQPTPIPFFVDPAYPYFRNLCVNLRLAGFGVNFDLQRPFPSPSPLALFEALGLVADPMMPIDPGGPLANVMRVTLRDARVTLPPAVLRLFPDAQSVAGKTFEITLNVATVIGAIQEAARAAGEMATAIEQGAGGLRRRLERLASAPPSLSVGALLDALPPELRKLRLGGSLAGFEARAVLVLVDAHDADRVRGALTGRGRPAPPNRPPVLALGASPDPDALDGFRPNLPGRGRHVDPGDPRNNLFEGIEFRGFAEEDIDAIPAPRQPMAGVILCANVRVFEGQRYRFLGGLWEDGSFGLVTAVDVEPLKLRLAGVEIACPLRVQGRIALEGRSRRDRAFGAVTASGVVRDWRVIPGVLRIDIGRRAPIRARLTSDGTFAFSGDLRAELFNGAATLEGTADVSETHCFVSGRFEQTVGPLDLTIQGSGRVGPGPHFELAGSGTLDIAGNRLVDVRGRVTEASARVEGRISTKAWRQAGVSLPCSLDMRLAGEVEVRRRRRPRFLLEGEATLGILDATIRGRGSLGTRSDGGLVARVEGALHWQGRDWLGGRVEISDRGIKLAGRTSLAFDLTPPNLATVQIASLFFKVDVEGEFTLAAAGGLQAFARVKGDWQLAVQLPASDRRRRQAFPIAMQSFELQAGVGIPLRKKLLEVRAMRVLPGNLTLPALTPTGHLRFRVHEHGFDISPIGKFVALIPEISGVHEHDSDSDPFPFPPADVKKKWTEIAKVPTGFQFAGDTITLPASPDFDLFLVWSDADRKLGVVIEPA